MNDQDLYEIAFYFFERLKLFSLFSKHAGFREEKEWRVVYFKDRDPEGKIEPLISYSIGSRGIEPILKYNLRLINNTFNANYSFENLIYRIILGPTTSSPLARNTVQRMLVEAKKPGLINKLTASTIPYRKNT